MDLKLSCFVSFARCYALNNYASVTRFLNSLRALAFSLLVKKISPLAVKTTGATVVFLLAPLSRSLVLVTQKKPPFRAAFNHWSATTSKPTTPDTAVSNFLFLTLIIAK